MRMKIIGSVVAACFVSASASAAATPPADNAGSLGAPGATGSAAGSASGSSHTTGAAAGRLSLAELCMHTRLPAADQADCKRQVSAATTETQRTEIRRTFEAKAGIRAGASGASGTSGTAPPQNLK